jgi:hypothetical protein
MGLISSLKQYKGHGAVELQQNKNETSASLSAMHDTPAVVCSGDCTNLTKNGCYGHLT